MKPKKLSKEQMEAALKRRQYKAKRPHITTQEEDPALTEERRLNTYRHFWKQSASN